jgi:hypothetical protein
VTDGPSGRPVPVLLIRQLLGTEYPELGLVRAKQTETRSLEFVITTSISAYEAATAVPKAHDVTNSRGLEA